MQIPRKISQIVTGRPPLQAHAALRHSSPLRPLRAFLYLMMGASLTFCPVATRSQVTQPQPPPGFSPGPPQPRDMDPVLRRMSERMAIERNTQRQQKIVDDTTRLLDLAKELNDAVTHSTKNTLSVAVVKKAEEIEKLAKTIKDKMRDGE